jgi:isopentenyl-diphosphate delta-isomerase
LSGSCLLELTVLIWFLRFLQIFISGAKRAAIRKLNQELGILSDQIPLEDLKFLTRIHYLAPSNGHWGEHEIDYIFLFQGDISLNINPNEVKSCKWISKDELKDLFEQNDLPMTPWFKLIVENFLYKWWDQLDNLENLKEDNSLLSLESNKNEPISQPNFSKKVEQVFYIIYKVYKESISVRF